MEFELRKRRNITDNEFVQDLNDVAKALKKSTITIDEYNKLGKYHSSSIIRRFGNWEKSLLKANLSSKKNSYSDINKKDFLLDIQRVAKERNTINLSAKEYDEYGLYNHHKIAREFKTWNNALKEAGLYSKVSKNLSETELFENLLNVWQKLGRQPYYGDMHKPLSICSAKPYVTKYGSWYSTLEKFIEYMNKDDKIEQKHESTNIITTSVVISEEYKHKTNRNINLRLRYKVLKRDNFTCKICGASPAKDPNVELHVDHIKPWAKGGETVLDNLQTLCSKCNLGKSDLYY